jgi:hypothetical protein
MDILSLKKQVIEEIRTEMELNANSQMNTKI